MLYFLPSQTIHCVHTKKTTVTCRLPSPVVPPPHLRLASHEEPEQQVAQPSPAGAFSHVLGESRIGRAYLKELQAIQPLSRGEEREICLRIEQGEQKMLQALLQVPSFRQAIRDLVQSAAEGRMRLDKLIEGDPNDELAVARVRRLASALDEASSEAEIAALLSQVHVERREMDRLLEGIDLEASPDMAAQFSEGEQMAQGAKGELVRRHLWLAVSIASRQWSRGVDLFDRIQEGNLGLIQAADRFRVRRGFRFATYAAFWVRKGINNAIADQGHCVRIPGHTLDAACRAEQIRRHRDAKSGVCTEDEVAGELSVSVERLREVRQGVSDALGLEDAGELVDGTPSAEHWVSLMERRRIIREQIDTLEEREQRVLRLRFGLDGEEEAGRDELGKVFCLTRERIRQIEKQAIERLQHPSRVAILQAV